LRPNVDAYTTNIDGFGHRFEPVIDLDAEDADKLVAQAAASNVLRLETQTR
jgi:capsid portal protein